ncbi:MAG TPA: xanthine dehydrogenase family protein subunit M [Thermodesulfobacteriota bacterium]|nr:xanthine dehydrogenase family protein subunit M [Thermodesulfobacteriota bacterium]
MQSFDYQKVFTLQEAFDAASASNGASAFLAGGTDLLVQIKEGKKHPRYVIDVKGVPEMAGVTLSGDELSIGALTSVRTLERSPSVAENAPLLAQAAAKLGSVQIRHRATIGGNLCNASPSADTAPALLALEAQTEIFGKTGARVMALDNFFLGPGTTVLGDGEILTRLKIPLSHKRNGSVYYKLSARKAMDLAFVGVAVLLELDGSHRISKARMALAAVDPTPIRVPSAEKLLEGLRLTPETARESAELAAQSCKPISDLRASADYRREMVRELCQQGLLAAYRQAKSSTEGKNE